MLLLLAKIKLIDVACWMLAVCRAPRRELCTADTVSTEGVIPCVKVKENVVRGIHETGLKSYNLLLLNFGGKHAGVFYYLVYFTITTIFSTWDL